MVNFYVCAMCYFCLNAVKRFMWIRFEAGTPAIGEAIGLGAAIDYLSTIGMQKIHDYEVKWIICSIIVNRIDTIQLCEAELCYRH